MHRCKRTKGLIVYRHQMKQNVEQKTKCVYQILYDVIKAFNKAHYAFHINT